jgi:hypothetical protein
MNCDGHLNRTQVAAAESWNKGAASAAGASHVSASDVRDAALLHEALRYLGCRGAACEPDLRTAAVLTRVLAELRTCVTPRHVYAVWDCQVSDEAVVIEPFRLESRKLARHMAGCDKAILLAATLGSQADMLVRRYDVTNIQAAVVAQALGAALIEEYLDEVEADILVSEGLNGPGIHHAKRFSPGYGDLNLSYQEPILRLLNAGKRIGLTLTAAGMLVPTKSVTAIFGVASTTNEE